MLDFGVRCAALTRVRGVVDNDFIAAVYDPDRNFIYSSLSLSFISNPIC